MEPDIGTPSGLTITDALAEFEMRGYVGQFSVAKDGHLECTGCGGHCAPKDVALEAMRRVEGASDPADMVFIGALRCESCGHAGTTVLTYGTNAPPAEAEILRFLDDKRIHTDPAKADHSLVSDSGWLVGPEG